jgi:hypothetical protein
MTAETAIPLGIVPGAAAVFEELWLTAWSVAGRKALEPAWHAIATTLGVDVRERGCGSGEADTVTAAYAEQFALDPGGVRGRLNTDLTAELGSTQVPTFVAALNIVEGDLRARSVLGLEPSAPPHGIPDHGTAQVAHPKPPPSGADGRTLRHYRQLIIDGRILGARSEFARLAFGLGNVDDLTTEAVRLRNAQHQQCLY